MLARAYRFTDKFSLFLLKLLTLIVSLITDGMMVLLGSGTTGKRRGILGIFSVIFGVVFAVFTVILNGLLAIGGAILAVGFSIARRLGINTVRIASTGLARATENTSSAAGGAMARRAARAQLDAGVAEDPLKAQNRILSGMVVMTLVALIGMVLWATRPQPPSLNPTTDNFNFGGSDGSNPLVPTNDSANGDANNGSSSIALATPIPTATQLPESLQARGSIAFTVRENGQTDLWAVGVGDSRRPIRITNDLADERSPAWSPDGRRLAYASNKEGNWEIYIFDLANPLAPARRMTYDLGFQAAPSWSPDGIWLTYENYQGTSLDICILPVDDDTLTVQCLPSSTPSAEFSPAWSPDGGSIAYTSWASGASQDIYVFSLQSQEIINLTNTPDRNEDYPAWFPDKDSENAGLIAYSAVDSGIEKVFVKSVNTPDVAAEAIGVGRDPNWSPDGASIIAAVDTSDATHLTVYAYTVTGIPQIISVPLNATSPVWTQQPLPVALVNSGGLPDASQVLYVEMVATASSPPYYRLDDIGDVDVENRQLNNRVNESFKALRSRTNDLAGWDFLGQLDDAWWTPDYRPQAGEPVCNWHLTGRAFSVKRSYPVVGFPPQVEVVREDNTLNTLWHTFVRVADQAQSGQLGEPLRRLPWDFNARRAGDTQAYEQGGRLRAEMPQGYYIDFTQIAADYGWLPFPAGDDWRANANTINYWMYYKPDQLDWVTAMLELYSIEGLGGCAPQRTPTPTN